MSNSLLLYVSGRLAQAFPDLIFPNRTIGQSKLLLSRHRLLESDSEFDSDYRARAMNRARIYLSGTRFESDYRAPGLNRARIYLSGTRFESDYRAKFESGENLSIGRPIRIGRRLTIGQSI